MIRSLLSAAVFATAVIGDGKCSIDESQLWINSASFTEAMQSCAIANFGAASGTTDCLRAKFSPALSANCATCFGATVECGRTKCLKDCIKDSASDSCVACTVSQGCTADLATCTGFTQGPPNPTKMLSTTPKSSTSISLLVSSTLLAFIAL